MKQIKNYYRSSKNYERVSNIEIQLTPRQWAINLVDEIRRHPSRLGLAEVEAKGQYRESPFMKPFFALEEQARRRFPGRSQEDALARQRRSAQLCEEFHALKLLIVTANKQARTKSALARLKVSALVARLDSMILRCALTQTTATATALIERSQSGEEGERQMVLKGLAQLTPATKSPTSLFLEAREWADELAMLLLDLFTCETTVEVLQNDYFDGHPILAWDVEQESESTIQSVLEMVAIFSEYVETAAHVFTCISNHSAANADACPPSAARESARWSTLRFEIESIRRDASPAARIQASEWKRGAIFDARAETLRESGKHEDFVWRNFREEYGGQPDSGAAR